MKISLLILGMAAVTFLPRILPAFIVDKLRFNRYLECFLKLIPYTAMAALIFPGILSVDGDRWYVGVVGAAVAIVLGLIPKLPSGFVVVGSVLSVLIFFL
ncbi:MAG: AzlD domain-containing protein [Clostridia bacterium]|nr:AzlD domain-containing protein [Clostridia bacterium]